MDKQTQDELLVACEVLAEMVLDEWPGPLAYATKTWGRADTPVRIQAMEKLEAYLDAKRTGGSR